jgi:hypothetical protein
VSSVRLAAIAAGAIAFLAYALTLLPGVSVGDWAEMQKAPAALDVPHPTGYPTYVLLGKLWSLLPIGSVAWRMNLLSALCTAGAVGTAVLVAGRLGVRPILAGTAGLLVAFAGTVWSEALVAEVNALHLLFVALLVLFALRWRDERRPSDLRIGALLAGLALGNHLLVLAVVPFVALFVLWTGRAELRERPRLLFEAVGLALVGLAVYAFIPIRAALGPADRYGWLLQPGGFWHLVSGGTFRQSMTFGSPESLELVRVQFPALVELVTARIHWVALPIAFLGLLALAFVGRDRRAPVATAVLIAAMLVGTVYLYAGYRGSLEHYLLVGFLVVGLGFGVAVEGLLRVAERSGPEAAVLVLPAVLLVFSVGWENWPRQDLSGDRAGEELGTEVFAALPDGAVLVTYWDTLTTLSYLHCVEGVRPDVRLQSIDPTETIACDARVDLGEAVRERRPAFALFVTPYEPSLLEADFRLVPVRDVLVPYATRERQFVRTLYRLEPRVGAVAER